MQHVFYLLLRRLRTPMITVVVVYAISILGFVLIPGVDDNGEPWRMDFFHAFYFVSFMGTTIGFGEIPYAFTTAQRAWAICTIYATVLSWLYSIGKIFALFQDPNFNRLLVRNNFNRAVRRIRDPFYLICGCGVTGSRLVHRLDAQGIQTVVIDTSQRQIDELETDKVGLAVPAICADAADPDLLNSAGLRLKNCAGVIALTDDDHTNLAVAIDSKLVFPDRPVISRTESKKTALNLDSFGTDHIIDPFETFAEHFFDSVTDPYKFILKDIIFNPHHKVLPSPYLQASGLWVICGYGRFGKAMEQAFHKHNIPVRFIEANPEMRNAPEDTIADIGTEADALLKAGIKDAVGIIAGTDNDADNLSIIITARTLKPNLFTVARQNQIANKPVFRAANVDLVMEPARIVADRIFILIKTPLTIHFVARMREQTEQWAHQILLRIGAIIQDKSLDIWTVTINQQQAPAIHEALADQHSICAGCLCRDPRNRDAQLAAMLLMIKRGNETIMLPEAATPLQQGDEILVGGQFQAQSIMGWVTDNYNVLLYLNNGIEAPGGWVWRWFKQRKLR